MICIPFSLDLFNTYGLCIRQNIQTYEFKQSKAQDSFHPIDCQCGAVCAVLNRAIGRCAISTRKRETTCTKHVEQRCDCG